MIKTDITPPTEGEEYVLDFLKEYGIKCEREKKIVGLVGDSKPYRKADFYLPQFKAYIEFMGMWNKNVKDDDYKEKKKVYRNNGIPCVYLYPENLGVLHFTLDKRLQRTLAENGKYNELKKYRWFKFFKSRRDNIVLLLLSIAGIISYIFHILEDNGILFFSVCAFIYQTYVLIDTYISIFIKDKFSLLKLKN